MNSHIVLFILAKKVEKNPKVHQQTKGQTRCVIPSTMEYYSAIKRNEVPIHAIIWVNFEK